MMLAIARGIRMKASSREGAGGKAENCRTHAEKRTMRALRGERIRMGDDALSKAEDEDRGMYRERRAAKIEASRSDLGRSKDGYGQGERFCGRMSADPICASRMGNPVNR